MHPRRLIAVVCALALLMTSFAVTRFAGNAGETALAQQTQPYRIFQFAIGGGTMLGRFDRFSDVAVAPDGTVYVADSASHRIHRFSATGEFLGGWGLYGTGDGHFRNPQVVAVAPDGTVYVMDSRYRIQRFSATGAFLGAWGMEGSGNGQFKSGDYVYFGYFPLDVAVAPDGTVYVADTGNHRIQRFSATGVFLGAWGTQGSGNGQFSYPHSVAVASDGTVYVLDRDHDRIQRFSATGAFLSAWGLESIFGFDARVGYRAVAVAPDGQVVYVLSWSGRIQRFSATGTFLGNWEGGSGSSTGVAVAPDGTVYINRHSFIQRFSATGTFLGNWETEDYRATGQLRHPSDVAVAPDGTVYVADSARYRIQRFSATGAFLGAWGSFGTGDGQFQFLPSRVAVAPDGTVYVAESSRIHRFSATGTFLGNLGSYGSGDGQFITPSGVAVAPDGTVYVADAGNAYVADGGNARIQRFSATGAFLGAWGSYGTGDGQFIGPSGVAVAPDGTVYVADGGNDRIQRFSATGAFLGAWGSYGTGDGQFIRPSGVAVAPDGTVYVADFYNNRIQHFSATGAFLGAWGTWGSGAGQFGYPRGVAVAPDGRIYVSDIYLDRIQVFGTGYPNAWRGEFFANDWLAGPVLHVEHVPDLFLNRSWAGQPAATIPADHFTSRWMRYVNFPTGGRYRFTIRADDGVRFWVDDRLVVESWQPQSFTREVTVELSAGYHLLLLEHWDQQGTATLALDWTPSADNATLTPTTTPTSSPPPPYPIPTRGRGAATPTPTLMATATATPTLTPTVAPAPPTLTPTVAPAPPTLTPTVAPAPPQPPSNLRQTGRTTTSITLVWQDNAANETGFYLYRWNGSTWNRIATLGANVTAYTDTGLSCGQSYRYRVSAYNAAGESAASELADATTSPCATDPAIGVDLTIGLYRNPNSQERAIYEEMIRYLADALFEMSNGAHKLRTVRIYPNSQSQKDVIWRERCWPIASISGYGRSQDGRRIQMCDIFDFGSGSYNYLQNRRAWEDAGYTIAHEMGHYFYSLYDEYRTDNPCDPERPSKPCRDDIPVSPSVMHSQWDATGGQYSWLNFSSAANYSTRTAQYRMYRASGWETLVRRPEHDPRYGVLATYPLRLYHPELRNVAPASGQFPRIDLITGHQARSMLQIIWEPPAGALLASAEVTAGLFTLEGNNVVYPQPVRLIAALQRALPIAGATVQGEVTLPNGQTQPLTFRDDGVAPDALADDGQYSALFIPTQDGAYQYRVTFTNPNQAAVEVYNGLHLAPPPPGYQPDDSLLSPVPVTENFTVSAQATVAVSGVRNDDHGNDPGAASLLNTDNLDQWGHIEQPGDRDLFRIAVPQDMTIVVRVTDLGAGMQARLRLLAEDGTTPLAALPLAENYPALAYTARAGSVLYAEVSHTDPVASGGVYRISAGSAIASDGLNQVHLPLVQR